MKVYTIESRSEDLEYYSTEKLHEALTERFDMPKDNADEIIDFVEDNFDGAAVNGRGFVVRIKEI